MSHLFKLSLALLLSITFAAACSQEKTKNSNTNAEKVSVTMYKNPGCECCTAWAEHMERNGFEVEEKPVDNLYALKFNYKVPNDMGACHTALIGDYVVEGHVPAEDVNRLLKEQPDAKGLAVPGMPTGSPGMEIPGRKAEPFDVMLFSEDGSRSVYASH